MDKLIDETVTDIKMLPNIDDLGLTNSVTVEINPQRIVGGGTTPAGVALPDKWTSGLIDTQFNINGNKRWVPSKSYFKAIAELQIGGAQPSAADSIAFAESFMTNIIASCSFYIGNVCVSRSDDYVGQTMMLQHRVSRDLNWLSSVGKDSYFLEPNFNKREELSSSDGVTRKELYSFLSDDAGTFYVDDHKISIDGDTTLVLEKDVSLSDLPNPTQIWNVGDSVEYIKQTPSGTRNFARVTAVRRISAIKTEIDVDLGLVTTPIGATLSAAELTRGRDTERNNNPLNGKNRVMILFQLPLGIFTCKSILPQGEFRFKITPKSNKLAGIQTIRDLSTIGADIVIVDFKLVNTIFNDNSNFNDDDYYIVLNEWELQNKKLNPQASLTSHNFIVPQTTHKIVLFTQDTGSGSGAGVSSNVPPSVFRATGDSSNDLRHVQMTFGGVTKPSNLFESSFSDTANNLTQRYLWNYQNTTYSKFGPELFNDWIERGWIYSTDFIRKKGDTSTQLQVQLDFGDLTNESTELFVACQYRNIVRVSVKNGLIVNVVITEG